jgi:hypothetical protein
VHLLYLDESGNEKGAANRHFVLAGAAIFERQTFYLAQQLDQIQAARFPGLPPEPLSSLRQPKTGEFHGQLALASSVECSLDPLKICVHGTYCCCCCCGSWL